MEAMTPGTSPRRRRTRSRSRRLLAWAENRRGRTRAARVQGDVGRAAEGKHLGRHPQAAPGRHPPLLRQGKITGTSSSGFDLKRGACPPAWGAVRKGSENHRRHGGCQTGSTHWFTPGGLEWTNTGSVALGCTGKVVPESSGHGLNPKWRLASAGTSIRAESRRK